MTTKAGLINQLNDLGIKVVAGKVRKSDIKKVLAESSNEEEHRFWTFSTLGFLKPNLKVIDWGSVVSSHKSLEEAKMAVKNAPELRFIVDTGITEAGKSKGIWECDKSGEFGKKGGWIRGVTQKRLNEILGWMHTAGSRRISGELQQGQDQKP